MCVCIWLCVVGSAWGQKTPFRMGSTGYRTGCWGQIWECLRSENLIQNGLNRVSGAYLVVPGVRKPIQNGLNRVLGPRSVMPELRKSHSEWA